MSRISRVPLVVSFYKKNSPSELSAKALIASCNEHGIDAEIEAIPEGETWGSSCAMRPFFIRKKLSEKKRPLFWVDAEAVFKKKPDFSFLNESDISFREMKKFSNDPRHKYSSGSLFLNYTARALEFLNKWCDHCQEQIDKNKELEFADQMALHELIERGERVKIFPLPISYCKVFDVDALEIAREEIVIEHLQASRRFRHWR